MVVLQVNAWLQILDVFRFSVMLYLLMLFAVSFKGCMKLIREQLNWGTKSELKSEVLRGIKEIGSVIYTMGLLDIVLVSPIRQIVKI